MFKRADEQFVPAVPTPAQHHSPDNHAKTNNQHLVARAAAAVHIIRYPHLNSMQPTHLLSYISFLVGYTQYRMFTVVLYSTDSTVHVIVQ